MTNYERIKNMSVEEMAVAIPCPLDIDGFFTRPEKCMCGEEYDCVECTKIWLNSEVE